MGKVVISIFVLFATFSGAKGQRCEYTTDGVKEVPFVWSTIELKGKAVRVVRGVTVDALGDVVTGATVVLWRLEGKKRIYLGTTNTDENGEFCFGQQPEGKYELNAGMRAFQKSVLKFIVSKKASYSKMNVEMDVGY